MRTIALAFLLTFSLLANAQFCKRPAWRDEFRGNGVPSSEIWQRSVTKVENERSFGYLDSVSTIYQKRGKAHIRLYKSEEGLWKYKGGRLITNPPYMFRKGKIVVRAKVPSIPGVWASLWFTGKNTKAGYHAEIDMMEYKNTFADSCYNANFHMRGNIKGKKKNHLQFPKRVYANVSKWHVYSLEVSDDRITILVDKKVVYDITRGSLCDEWPDGELFSFRMSLSYGGWGAKGCGTDDSKMPVEMLIDYVRFYDIES